MSYHLVGQVFPGIVEASGRMLKLSRHPSDFFIFQSISSYLLPLFAAEHPLEGSIFCPCLCRFHDMNRSEVTFDARDATTRRSALHGRVFKPFLVFMVGYALPPLSEEVRIIPKIDVS